MDDIAAALSASSIQKAIHDFLGTTASRALVENLQACEESLLEIAKSIDSLLPATVTTKQVTLATLLSRNGAHQGVTVWKGVKLALSRSELDRAIQKIDSATSLLDKLQSTRTAIGQIESNEPSKRSKRLVKRLTKTSMCAERLYQGLLASWLPPCHTDHKVHLYLEDRVLDHNTTKGSQVSSSISTWPAIKRPLATPKPPAISVLSDKSLKIEFHLVFSGDIPQPSGRMLWHENHILVDEDDYPMHSSIGSTKLPKVTIVTPSGNQAPAIKKWEMRNMCFSIGEAERLQTKLELFLLPHPKIHYAFSAIDKPLCVVAKDMVDLESLIRKASTASERLQKLPLKARLQLALTLASNTVQLSSTQWLRHTWSKKSVCFMTSPTTGGHQPPVDLTRPVLCEDFPEVPVALTGSTTQTPGARSMLLELGIILLELWNETTLELYYASTKFTVRDDYFTRLSLAQRWLEESENYMLPAYHDAVARCIRTQFDGCPVNPVWDETLRAGLMKSVIEPLLKQCKVGA